MEVVVNMQSNHLKTIVTSTLMCSILGGTIAYSTPADAKAVKALAAHRFVNAVGVSTHFTWGPSPYRRRFAQAKAALAELGVRHIRDAVGNTSANAVFRNLGSSLGVKLCAVVDTRTGSGARTRLNRGAIQAKLNSAKNQIGRGMLRAIEGPNEYNQMQRDYGYKGWAQELRSYQAELRRRVKADPVLRSLPVVAPSLADPMQASYYRQLGNLSGSIDRGNAHVYPNWLSWDQKIKKVIPYARISAPSQPIWTTETGWHMAFNSGAQWVPDSVLIKYLPRAMATFVSTGAVERAYIYQLIDPHNNPAKTKTTSHFGLISYNMQRKQSFYAVRNTMHVMCDSPRPATQSLRYSLSGNLANVRTQLYQKRNGAFYLVAWVEKQSFFRNRVINNPPQAVRIRFEQPISQARAYRPSEATGGIARSNLPKQTYVRPTTVNLSIGDALTILEIVPQGTALPGVSTRCSFAAN